MDGLSRFNVQHARTLWLSKYEEYEEVEVSSVDTLPEVAAPH